MSNLEVKKIYSEFTPRKICSRHFVLFIFVFARAKKQSTESGARKTIRTRCREKDLEYERFSKEILNDIFT